MTTLMGQITGHFDYTLLMFLRVSGLFLPSPIFGRRALPNLIKICFCLFLTYLFLSSFPFPDEGIKGNTQLGYFLLCLKELLFGLTLGFILTMFFEIVMSAGHLMDVQIGFGMASIYDIQSNSQVPVVGNLLNLMQLIVFYGVDGHLKVIDILYQTIERIPIGRVAVSTELAAAIIEAFSTTFVLAIMVAMPILAAGVILELAMGVLIKAVPQVNMFVIGIPVKLFVGLIIFAASVPIFGGFSETIFVKLFAAIKAVFDTFGVLT